ncbi:MAG: DUF2281 domain-containing protein [Cyanobacteria bacterium P01_D01_bin.156]
MTIAETIYELVNQLPEEQAKLVWLFAQFIQQKTQTPTGQRFIPAGTLTSLRGIAKQPGAALTDESLTNNYTDYLIQKYQ